MPFASGVLQSLLACEILCRELPPAKDPDRPQLVNYWRVLCDSPPATSAPSSQPTMQYSDQPPLPHDHFIVYSTIGYIPAGAGLCCDTTWSISAFAETLSAMSDIPNLTALFLLPQDGQMADSFGRRACAPPCTRTGQYCLGSTRRLPSRSRSSSSPRRACSQSPWLAGVRPSLYPHGVILFGFVSDLVSFCICVNADID